MFESVNRSRIDGLITIAPIFCKVSFVLEFFTRHTGTLISY
jgi:hypothetical protein